MGPPGNKILRALTGRVQHTVGGQDADVNGIAIADDRTQQGRNEPMKEHLKDGGFCRSNPEHGV